MRTASSRLASSASLLLFFVSCNNLPTEPEPTLKISASAVAAAEARTRTARVIRAIDPPCINPAPLNLANRPAPGYIVRLKDGTDATAVASMLAQRYGFTLTTVWTQQSIGFPAFYAIMSIQTVAALRCESTVTYIEENSLGVPLSVSRPAVDDRPPNSAQQPTRGRPLARR